MDILCYWDSFNKILFRMSGVHLNGTGRIQEVYSFSGLVGKIGAVRKKSVPLKRIMSIEFLRDVRSNRVPYLRIKIHI